VPTGDLIDPKLGSRLWKRTPKRSLMPQFKAGLAGERGESEALLRPDDGGTSHLSVIDSDGMALALTTTVNLYFGAKLLDPGTGLVLNDEMDDFTAHPGQPNAFGLVQGSNNAVAAGKRPLSSMSPTLVTDAAGRVVLALGAAGGPRIITGTLQTLLGVLDHDLSPADSVAAPRIHHQWLPAAVVAESGLPAAGRSRLDGLGVPVQEGSHRAVVHVVAFDPQTGTWSGGADPRAGGAAVVRPSVRQNSQPQPRAEPTPKAPTQDQPDRDGP
jgi:gamma-glutamyltranspeptidase/glutathione hydrolase